MPKGRPWPPPSSSAPHIRHLGMSDHAHWMIWREMVITEVLLVHMPNVHAALAPWYAASQDDDKCYSQVHHRFSYSAWAVSTHAFLRGCCITMPHLTYGPYGMPLYGRRERFSKIQCHKRSEIAAIWCLEAGRGPRHRPAHLIYVIRVCRIMPIG